MQPTQAPPTVRYRDAVDELKAIIRGIESEDVDLDELGPKVERAAELIRACRQTIDKTEMSVRQVLDDLAREGEGG